MKIKEYFISDVLLFNNFFFIQRIGVKAKVLHKKIFFLYYFFSKIHFFMNILNIGYKIYNYASKEIISEIAQLPTIFITAIIIFSITRFPNDVTEDNIELCLTFLDYKKFFMFKIENFYQVLKILCYSRNCCYMDQRMLLMRKNYYYSSNNIIRMQKEIMIIFKK